jgi:hypothetical protein
MTTLTAVPDSARMLQWFEQWCSGAEVGLSPAREEDEAGREAADTGEKASSQGQ